MHRQGGGGPPVGHGALLRDGVAPHGEAHAHDGAGNEDQEEHEGADQQAQEGVEEGAAARMGAGHCASPAPTAPLRASGQWEACPHPHVPSWGLGPR